jgi:RHS repeat-associated protein
MGNRPGTDPQLIALPTGGGAQRGIGETFAPDLQTGTGNFSVPIAVATGRSGFQPHLNLVYSSGQGNGPFGLGWSLSVPGVARKTAKGVPRYRDEAAEPDEWDTFILSGAEDLVPLPKDGLLRFRPRTEGLFARIERLRGDSGDYWEVRSKDGLISRYGTRRPQSSGPDWRDPAAIGQPTDRIHVFAWKLTQTSDPFGNQIVYDYRTDEDTSPSPHWVQSYLARIRYVDYADGNKIKFLVSVTFTYELRPDVFSDHRAGFEIRTRLRCSTITVATHAGQDRTVRTYHLIYEQAPLNGVSLLRQVELVGFDGVDRLPPLEFGYTRFEPDRRRDLFPVTGPDAPPASLSRPDYELADLTGDGLPDVLQMHGTARYWRNIGGGQFDRPQTMREAPAGLALADPGVQLMDADGDGRIDLVVSRDGLAGYYPLRFDGCWDRASFRPYRPGPTFSLEDPEVKLVDLDGDGVADLIRAGSRLVCAFNDPDGGRWHEPRWLRPGALEGLPAISFADPRVRWADLSGDGLQDLVLVHNGSVQYWPSLGHGNWGPPVTMRRGRRFPWTYNPARLLLGDVDGDGLADLVYVDDSKVTLWINQSGNAWSDPVEIAGTPPISDMDAVRLVDLLGSGIRGVLWTSDRGSGLPRANMYFLDLTGAAKPNLLNRMDNHLGAVTLVEYHPSTVDYLRDQGRPETHWRTPLPFPVQVVGRVEVIDAISRGKLTTEYRYHHGYWDGGEREFRGFGMVEQQDTEVRNRYNAPGMHGDADFRTIEDARFSPPMLTKTWFHLGPVGDEFGGWEGIDYRAEFWKDDPPAFGRHESVASMLAGLVRRRDRRDALRALRGRILRTELYAQDGSAREDRPYTVTESQYGLREERSPGPDEGDRRRIFFPYLVAQRTTQWERGDDPLTQLAFTGDYDRYGQPQSQVSIAVPRGRRFSAPVPLAAAAPEPYLGTHTRTVYAQRDDESIYIVDRVARTTTWDVANDGRITVEDLRQRTATGALDRDDHIIAQTLSSYDGPAFVGLGYRQIGDRGALVRSESLVLTEAILAKAYPEQQPPYLDCTGTVWTPEYPTDFRARVPALAGYVYHDGVADPAYTAGYYVTTERRRYDFHDGHRGGGLITLRRDPLGGDTKIAYDEPYHLLPVRLTDATALETVATYDYRVFLPSVVTDPNDNQTRFTFNALGLLAETWVQGKTAQEGDRLRPSSRLEYDFTPVVPGGQPISVRTIRHVYHDTETDVPLPRRDATIETREYSDGFGRLVQTRTQAGDLLFADSSVPPAARDLTFGNAVVPRTQPAAGGNLTRYAAADPIGAPRVTVSGWEVYDNKGRVVEKFEPFFDESWDFEPPDATQFGRSLVMAYDPRGHVIWTVNPDRSEQRVIHGIPAAIDDPDTFVPTPWEAYTYDANDNAGRTHGAATQGYRHHWNTPSNIVIDTLGRTVLAVERKRAAPSAAVPNPPVEEYRTESTYDSQGNLLTVTDPLGRLAFGHVYDLAKHSLRVVSIDAGIQWTVRDALGNPVEQGNGKGGLALHAYDLLHRPNRLWARDGANEQVTLREILEYGDAGDPAQPAPARTASRATNRLTKLYRHFDEAGLLTLEGYDFKGNVLEKVRRVVRDRQILAGSATASAANGWRVIPFRMNWKPPVGTPLDAHADVLLQPESREYRTSPRYDALNRLKAMLYPRAEDGTRRALTPTYNRAGTLERVELDGAVFVEHIGYNAKGQRTFIVYGNGVLTRYAYDPETFRLVRMRTERFSRPATGGFRPTGTVLQDLAYGYDLAGNILEIREREPHCGIPNSPLGLDALNREFLYDSLYRLIAANGRECNLPASSEPWDPGPRCHDPTQVRAYSERYEYDRAGNLIRLSHQAATGAYTRILALLTDSVSGWPVSNRLSTVRFGPATTFGYDYDPGGNLTSESISRHFEWDYADRLRVFRTQLPNAPASEHAQYLYDAAGQRVIKLVRHQGGDYEVTVHVDGVFEEYRWSQGTTQPKTNTRLHVMDNQSRIAVHRIGDSDDAKPDILYHLGDHLGSSSVVIDDGGGVVNREEFLPYGGTSFGSFTKKRYRFTGKERDEESGLCYHSARYYAPWLGRWASCDPADAAVRRSGGHLGWRGNTYSYCQNRPLVLVDTAGLEATPSEAGRHGGTYRIGSLHLIDPKLSPPTSMPNDVGDVPIPLGSLGSIGIPPLFGGKLPGKTPQGEYEVSEQFIHAFEARGSAALKLNGGKLSLRGAAYGGAKGVMDWNPKAGYAELSTAGAELDVVIERYVQVHFAATMQAKVPTGDSVTLSPEGLSALLRSESLTASAHLSASLRVGNFRLLTASGTAELAPQTVTRNLGVDDRGYQRISIEQERQLRALGEYSAPLVFGGRWSLRVSESQGSSVSVSGHSVAPVYLGAIGVGAAYAYFNYRYTEGATVLAAGIGTSFGGPSPVVGGFFHHSW